MTRILFIAGTFFGGLGVVLGAFGAHALKTRLSSEALVIYEVAVKYQFIHALALLATSWATTQWSHRFVGFAGPFFIVGIFIFSGSLYLLSFSGVKWLGAITPLGGLSFIAGWVSLLLGVFLSQNPR